MPNLRFALRSGAVKQDSILVTSICYMDTDTAHSFSDRKMYAFLIYFANSEPDNKLTPCSPSGTRPHFILLL